jgi:hypothetical protein
VLLSPRQGLDGGLHEGGGLAGIRLGLLRHLGGSLGLQGGNRGQEARGESEEEGTEFHGA